MVSGTQTATCNIFIVLLGKDSRREQIYSVVDKSLFKVVLPTICSKRVEDFLL